jgi:hypothetical protein
VDYRDRSVVGVTTREPACSHFDAFVGVLVWCFASTRIGTQSAL